MRLSQSFLNKSISYILALLMLSGCSSTDGAKSTDDYSATVTDAAGREVTINGEPQRIISGYYISTSILLSLGQKDRLVGVEAKADTRNLYSLSAPEIIELPSVGTAKEFNLETALSLEADLIILPLKLSETASVLEEMGQTVILVNPESLDDLYETINMIAAACNADSSSLLGYIDEKKEFLASISDNNFPEVYLAGNSSYLRTAGSSMYQSTMISLGGGQNAADDITDTYWADISYEQLLAYDPEYIIIAPDAEYDTEDIYTDAELSALTAVKNGNVYAMPSSVEAWDSPVPGTILGSLWIAQTLYPDAYPYDAFVADADEFYNTFYGFDVTDEMLSH